jgi:hypothetical protein
VILTEVILGGSFLDEFETLEATFDRTLSLDYPIFDNTETDSQLISFLIACLESHDNRLDATSLLSHPFLQTETPAKSWHKRSYVEEIYISDALTLDDAFHFWR